MISLETLAPHIHRIRQSIPDSVRLIAVTKNIPVESMRVAHAAGLHEFAESRIQEAQIKQAQLQDLSNITWHFIGHLQRNKAKLALTHFDWIHSVDSLRLAEHLDTLIASGAPSPQLCLQVKLREDPSKYGLTPAELSVALPTLASYSHLNLQGLMTILPRSIPAAETGSIFAELKTLAQTLQQDPYYPLSLPELSMGMSDDYQSAIQAGATMIRLGRILFPFN
jgi:hypothetical protein